MFSYGVADKLNVERLLRHLSKVFLVLFLCRVGLNSLSAQEPPRVDHEMIVKLKSSVAQTEQDILKVLAESIRFHQFAETLTHEKDVEILGFYAWANMYHIRISEREDFEAKMEALRKLPEVAYVESNYLLSLDTTLEALDYKPAPEDGRDETTGKAAVCNDVVVAVIDTGVDDTHVDIKDHLWQNSGEISDNGIDDDRNGYVDDTRGWNFVRGDNDPYDDHLHGTHVSGIVLSKQNPLNPFIKIMPVKFLNSAGEGVTSDAIRAIDYALSNGARILNNSWGGGSYSAALRDAIVSSYQGNRIFVVSAGNSAIDMDQYPSYPPSYLVPNMISVAALDDRDSLAWFSNWGPLTVHVGAPGVSIRSSVPKEMCGSPPCYGYLSGTSMSAPYVSGVSAMMLCENPGLMHLQVKKIVMETSVSNATLAGKIGQGSVSDENAILMAANTDADTGDIPAYTPSSIPNPVGGDPDDSLYAATTMGCGAIVDKMNRSGGGGPAAGSGLFLFSWPFLFALMLRFFLLNRRRKFLFCP